MRQTGIVCYLRRLFTWESWQISTQWIIILLTKAKHKFINALRKIVFCFKRNLLYCNCFNEKSEIDNYDSQDNFKYLRMYVWNNFPQFPRQMRCRVQWTIVADRSILLTGSSFSVRDLVAFAVDYYMARLSHWFLKTVTGKFKKIYNDIWRIFGATFTSYKIGIYKYVWWPCWAFNFLAILFYPL